MDQTFMHSQVAGQALGLIARCAGTASWLITAFALLAGMAVAAPPAGYTLSWAEEFNGAVGSKPDATRWNYDLGGGGWGNSELETYVSDATHAQIVDDPAAGDSRALQIQATKDAQGNYTSARLLTKGKVSAQYGYIEGRIKIPYGQGVWPAFWMLGTDIGTVGWPSCGEIDIMENIGNERSTVHGTIHGPGYSGGSSLGAPYTLPNGLQFKDAYHTFAVWWRPDAITWDVDGITYETRTKAAIPSGATWAFNKPFFLLLNLAIGGQWPGYPDATTVFPQNLRVDYIRVYTHNPPFGHTVTLKSLANNKFVSAGAGGTSSLIASQTSAGTSEQFQVIDAGGGSVALKSLANGKYVTAPNAGASALIANMPTVGTSEQFLWVEAGSSIIALEALVNSRYVTAENAGASPLIANRTAASTWENFTVGSVGPPDPGVLADAGSALQAAGGGLSLTASEALRLNVEKTGGSASALDLSDAVRLVRRANGLDTF
ncbi:MAG TPA: family 16 glycosylhydrolase [Armatimonadota bacterium]|jgi:beta-glucanase (GH16 family)